MSLSGYVASETVRYRRIDGCGIVLDLCSQKYSVLDDLATAMWEILTDEIDAVDCIDRWERECDITRGEIIRTIEDFRAECLKIGWLTRRVPASWRKPARKPGRLSNWCARLPDGFLAFSALTFTALSLRFMGFGRTYGRRREIRGVPRSAVPPLQPFIRTFLAVENFVFLKRAPNDCLVRSLALFHYLRWQGVPATHVIGIRRVPFAAHAWVEVAGEPLLAPAPRGFSTLATLTAVCQ